MTYSDFVICYVSKYLVSLKQFLVLSLKESTGLAFTFASSNVSLSSLFGLLGLSPLRLVAP